MRQVVFVSGAPGAGKSTLAPPLAQALVFPLLSKDIIKERLADSLANPGEDPLVWSRRLGGAAMELIWTLAALSPAVVLEANFRPRSPVELERFAGLGARMVEVHCVCSPLEASRRYSARARTADRHPIHALHDLPAELLAEYDQPVGLGDLVEVNTEGPVAVEMVAQAVRRLLG